MIQDGANLPQLAEKVRPSKKLVLEGRPGRQQEGSKRHPRPFRDDPRAVPGLPRDAPKAEETDWRQRLPELAEKYALLISSF